MYSSHNFFTLEISKLINLRFSIHHELSLVSYNVNEINDAWIYWARHPENLDQIHYHISYKNWIGHNPFHILSHWHYQEQMNYPLHWHFVTCGFCIGKKALDDSRNKWIISGSVIKYKSFLAYFMLLYNNESIIYTIFCLFVSVWHIFLSIM